MRATICFLLVLSALTNAQQTSKKPTAHDAEAHRCHNMLHSWLDKSGFPSTNDLSPEELKNRIVWLSDCVTGESLATVKDLRLAYSTLLWYEETQRERNATALNALIATQQAKITPAKPASVLTVSMMPLGYTRGLNVGGTMENCRTTDGQLLQCNKAVDNVWDASFVAMIATPKSKADDPWTYLIGCSAFSRDCNPLVPGDYPYELTGGGITIAGLVPDAKPNEPVRHGLYTILARW